MTVVRLVNFHQSITFMKQMDVDSESGRAAPAAESLPAVESPDDRWSYETLALGLGGERQAQTPSKVQRRSIMSELICMVVIAAVAISMVNGSPPSGAKQSLPKVTANTAARPSTAIPAKRSPYQPPPEELMVGHQTKTAQPVQAISPKRFPTVSGTFMSGSRGYVVTADGMYGKGETIGAFRVEAVTVDAVVLKSGNSLYRYSLESRRWSPEASGTVDSRAR
jgi:hypothetical protein